MRSRTLRLLALSLLASGHALAAPSGLALSWSAPDGCPRHEAVDAAVAKMVGEAAGSDEPISVTATVRQTATGWEVELARPDGTSRLLAGASCRAVSEAATVVLALMVDPLARTSELSALQPDPESEPRGGVWLAVALDTHALPRPAPGLVLGGSVRLGAGFWLELQALALLQQSRQADEAGAGATVSLFSGTLGARRDFTLGPIAIAPWLGFEAGVLRGRSWGVSEPAVNVAPWSALAAGLRVAYTLGPIQLGVRGSVAVPLTRATFVIAGVGEAHTPAPITARGIVFAELLIPPRMGGATRH